MTEVFPYSSEDVCGLGQNQRSQHLCLLTMSHFRGIRPSPASDTESSVHWSSSGRETEAHESNELPGVHGLYVRSHEARTSAQGHSENPQASLVEEKGRPVPGLAPIHTHTLTSYI